MAKVNSQVKILLASPNNKAADHFLDTIIRIDPKQRHLRPIRVLAASRTKRYVKPELRQHMLHYVISGPECDHLWLPGGPLADKPDLIRDKHAAL